MRLRYIFVITGFVVAGTAWSWIGKRSTGPEIAQISTATVSHGGHADTEGCGAGCELINHPIEPLSSDEYFDLLGAFASDDRATHIEAFEELLFHGGQVRSFVAATGTPMLGSGHASLLRRELSKTHVRLWMRLVDDEGVVRGSIDGVSFPIGEKTHVHMATQNLDPLEASGTIHRTGLHHLWTRM